MVLRKTLAVACITAASKTAIAFVPTVPTGWSEAKKDSNVIIYKNRNNDYMQVINISGGAKVRLIQEYAGFRSDVFTDYHPGPMHSFYKYSPNHWWTKENIKPFSLVNGQFFAMTTKSPNKSLTYLSYPIRMDHQYAQGYNNQDLSYRDRQLEINSHAADILPFNASRAEHGPNPIVISGFHPDSNFPNAKGQTARTVICSRYINNSWLLYIGTLNKKDRNGIKTSMSSWGCNIQNKTLVLDGGGSTFLRYKSSPYVHIGNTERAIPQTIAIYN